MEEATIDKNRKEIISLLYSTNRNGIKNLVNFLFESHYFFSYGSYNHHKHKGGLAEHSLEVCKIAMKNNQRCPQDSVIISALLHDLCKVRFDFAENGIKEGHGTRSLSILEDYLHFELTPEERRAIRFHMGSRSNLTREDANEYKKASGEELWKLIHTSDSISAGHYSSFSYPLVDRIMKVFKL